MSHRVLHLIKSLRRGEAEVLLAEGLTVADRERFAYGYGYFLPWKDAVVSALGAHGADVICFDAPSNARILLTGPRRVIPAGDEAEVASSALGLLVTT